MWLLECLLSLWFLKWTSYSSRFQIIYKNVCHFMRFLYRWAMDGANLILSQPSGWNGQSYEQWYKLIPPCNIQSVCHCSGYSKGCINYTWNLETTTSYFCSIFHFRFELGAILCDEFVTVSWSSKERMGFSCELFNSETWEKEAIWSIAGHCSKDQIAVRIHQWVPKSGVAFS